MEVADFIGAIFEFLKKEGCPRDQKDREASLAGWVGWFSTNRAALLIFLEITNHPVRADK
jgi:hypothetical protein